jgi:hypothetical protein
MKQSIPFLIAFVIGTAINAQDTGNLSQNYSLFKSGYNLRKPLTQNINLNTGAYIANYGAFNQFELPLLVEFSITKKWALSVGTEFSSVTNYTTNLLEPVKTGFSRLDASGFLGTTYQFSKTTSGEFSLKYSIRNTNAVTNPNLNPDTPMRFNFGLKF